jgi:hypothetical protein
MRLALCLLSAALLSAQQDPPSRVARLNYATGPVSFQPAGESDWLDAPINRPLIPGDSLWSPPNARAELHIGSAALRLNANTAFQLLNLDDQSTQIRLSEGTLTIHVRQFEPRELFEIDTPNLAFSIYAPGEYRIDVRPDTQTTTITVRDGNGEVTGSGQSFPLSTRQQAVITGDQQIAYRLNSSPVTDAWDQWCTTRDRREEQSQSARYVSREMAGYEDLDQYGSWSNQSGYGDVWMPTSVSSGWAPYRDGHWAWISPWGWTWVDDAPWGFAPYHYGRWASFGNRWGWVPGPRGMNPTYAPALVAWIGGAGFGASVGWFALGPREPYFPSYQVSQNYFRRVNNTNTVFNNNTIDGYYQNSRGPNNTAINTIQYRNRGVQNGVIAVPHDAFAGGRRVGQNGRAVPPSQLGGTQVYSTPNIAPRHESVLGSRGSGGASRGAQPPVGAFSRPAVARTAPPPSAVPFNRQQEALTGNRGRPLAPAVVQQLRQGAAIPGPQIRVIDPAQNRRGQPQQAQQPQPPARQQQQPERPQQQQQQAPARQQQQRERPQQQEHAQQPQPTPQPQPQPSARQQQQRERPQQQQQQQAQQPQPTPQPQPQPPARQQQRERPKQQQQQAQQPPPQAAQPPEQRQEKGRPDKTERKQNP